LHADVVAAIGLLGHVDQLVGGSIQVTFRSYDRSNFRRHDRTMHAIAAQHKHIADIDLGFVGFDIDEQIIRGDYKIPPMILQPFVENAIHHGLMNKLDKDKQVRIEGQFIEGSLRFVVEDNGIGRSKAAEYKRINKPDHQSMGMEITQERINHFNADGSNTVNIIDLYTDDGKPAGTRIEICITNQN